MNSSLSSIPFGEISDCLAKGGVIAYPTESVYGFGCDPDDIGALQKILDIKQRPAEKGLIILVSDWSQADPYILPLTSDQKKQLSQQGERATTWLLPRKPDLSEFLCGSHPKLAVRLTSHPIAKAICDATGKALVSTSCNRASEPELSQFNDVIETFGNELDYVVNGECGHQNPSQIIDLASGHVLRN